jgi:hypothetical protein
LKKSKTPSARRSLDRLQRLARERADEQARRISWQRLLKARTQYVDWQEFYLWVRSILQVGPDAPEWLIDPRTGKNRENYQNLTPHELLDHGV